jgi:hypothetical protein
MISGDLGLYGERLAVVLGFATLTLFLSMGLTCRTFSSLATRFGVGRIIRSKPYQAMFKLHSFFWYGVAILLFLHMITGIMHTEIPRSGDPSAPLHWAILIFAVGLLVSIGLTFSNCRSFAAILRIFRGDKVFAGAYRPFFGFHSYFWILLLLALAGHLAASYVHIGFWPTVIE